MPCASRASCMTCSRVLHALVLYVLRALRALVPRAPRFLVPHVPRALRALRDFRNRSFMSLGSFILHLSFLTFTFSSNFSTKCCVLAYIPTLDHSPGDFHTCHVLHALLYVVSQNLLHLCQFFRFPII